MTERLNVAPFENRTWQWWLEVTKLAEQRAAECEAIDKRKAAES